MDRLESLAGRLAHDFNRLPGSCESPEEFLASAGLVSELTAELERYGDLAAVRPRVSVLVVAGDADTATSLRRTGYEVLEAVDADGALRLCAEYDGPIHILLTRAEDAGLHARAAALRPEIELVCLPAEALAAW